MWLAKKITLIILNLVSVKAGDVVQMVERLLGVHEVLSLMAGAI